MNTQFTQDEFNKATSRTKLKLICNQCNKIFLKEKRFITLVFKHEFCHFPCATQRCKEYASSCLFCSHKCSELSQTTKTEVDCKQCCKKFIKPLGQQTKTKNNFCSSSCAATYNNTHKTTGSRRSKLEIWLEKKLKTEFPQIKFEFNDKTIINSELDIYLPEYKLAFELNGIFHYEPIYGDDKLSQIQNNDNRKFQACLEKSIELCILDTSKMKYFKNSNAIPYFEIIKKIILGRMP